MRKLILLATLCAVAVLTVPSTAAAQGVGSRCKSNTAICIGDKNNDVYIGGNIYVNSPDGGSSVSTPGSATNSGTFKVGILDAGVARINGALTVTGTVTASGTTAIELLDAGNANIQGVLGLNQALHCGADVACGTIALVSGTPSQATKTVTSGSTCFCWPVGTNATIAAAGCAANVSSTTATFTGPNTVTTTVGYMCFK